MRKIISLLFLVAFYSIKVFAQFNSEPDVLMYLNGKTFTKESVGVSLSFSEVGSQLSLNGNLKFYQPNIRIVSKNKASVTYIGITDPSVKVGLIVDCTLNTVEDRSIGSVYSYNSSSGQLYNSSAGLQKNENQSSIVDWYYKDKSNKINESRNSKSEPVLYESNSIPSSKLNCIKCLESLKTPLDLLKSNSENINRYYNKYYHNISSDFETRMEGGRQVSYYDFVNDKHNSYQIDENSAIVYLISFYPPESFSKSTNYYLKAFHPIIGPLQFYFDEKGFNVLPGQNKKSFMTSKPYLKGYGFTLHVRVGEDGKTETTLEDSYLEHIFNFESQFANIKEYPKDTILNTLYANKRVIDKTETVEVYGRKGSRHFLNDCFESLQSTYSNYFIFKSNDKYGILDASERNWKTKNFIILENKYDELTYNIDTETFNAKINGDLHIIDIKGTEVK